MSVSSTSSSSYATPPGSGDLVVLKEKDGLPVLTLNLGEPDSQTASSSDLGQRIAIISPRPPNPLDPNKKV